MSYHYLIKPRESQLKAMKDITTEKWQPVIGWEEDYEVSSLGRVRRMSAACGTFPGRILRAGFNGKGKPFVILRKTPNKWEITLSRLVALNFIPNPDNKPEVNHKDGDCFNNSVDNLEWNTQAENIQHAIMNGLMPKGSKIGTSKLKEYQVEEIRKKYCPPKVSRAVLAREYGVSKSCIRRIIHRENWKHIL